VAGWVARRLLLSQTEPWADADFITTWQTEMPGLHFPVHRDLLRGIAVVVEEGVSGTTTTTKLLKRQKNQRCRFNH
jgi:Sister chromatid cohesion protein Dcc1